MLSFRDDGKWVVEPGEFTVMVGDSSVNLKQKSFELED